MRAVLITLIIPTLIAAVAAEKDVPDGTSSRVRMSEKEWQDVIESSQYGVPSDLLDVELKIYIVNPNPNPGDHAEVVARLRFKELDLYVSPPDIRTYIDYIIRKMCTQGHFDFHYPYEDDHDFYFGLDYNAQSPNWIRLEKVCATYRFHTNERRETLKDSLRDDPGVVLSDPERLITDDAPPSASAVP